MNKENLKKELTSKKVEFERTIEVLEMIKNIDLSKYNGKKISKRIATYVEKNLRELNSNFRFYAMIIDEFKPKSLLIVAHEKGNYDNKCEIEINLCSFEDAYNGKSDFDVDFYNQDLERYIKLNRDYVSNANHDLENIDLIVTEHKKIIDSVENFNRNILKSNFIEPKCEYLKGIF